MEKIQQQSHLVENGIKDLIASYFLDNCPGTDPYLVDVHFLIVSICRTLFRMIERDLSQHLTNSDGTVKTLSRMREILFRTGSATIKVQDDALAVCYANSFPIRITNILKQWFDLISVRHAKGLRLLGGLRIKFELPAPLGDDRRNSGTKLPFAALKNFSDDD